MTILEFLMGVSPWWWVAFAIVLGVLEMLTGGFFLIWPALGAIATAIALVIAPDLAPEWQLTIFAAVSLVLTYVGRSLLLKYGDGGGDANETLNQRTRHLIGRTAEVLERNGPNGYVEIEGMRWRARWAAEDDSAPGDRVKITGGEGMVIDVEKAK